MGVAGATICAHSRALCSFKCFHKQRMKSMNNISLEMVNSALDLHLYEPNIIIFCPFCHIVHSMSHNCFVVSSSGELGLNPS